MILFFMLLTSSCLSFAQDTDTIPPVPKDSVMIFKDGGALFPGGPNGWKRYLERTLRLPEEAVEKGIEGEVFIKFLVDEEGNVSDVKSIAGNKILATECIRLIKGSGKWVPYAKDGKNIKTYKIQPITFKVNR